MMKDDRINSAGENENVKGISFGWVVVFTVSLIVLIALLYWIYISDGAWAVVRGLIFILGWRVANKIEEKYPELAKQRLVRNPLLYFRTLLMLVLFNAFGIALGNEWLGIFFNAIAIVLILALTALGALHDEEREKLKTKAPE